MENLQLILENLCILILCDEDLALPVEVAQGVEVIAHLENIIDKKVGAHPEDVVLGEILVQKETVQEETQAEVQKEVEVEVQRKVQKKRNILMMKTLGEL